MTVIGRAENLDGNHTYVHPVTGEIYPSVTSIISATNSKPFLVAWAAKLAAEWAADNHLLIGQLLEAEGRQAAVDVIKGAAKRKREVKADTGSYVHTVVEALILDTPGGWPSIPDELVGKDYDGEPLTKELVDAIVDGFLAFCAHFDVAFEMAEVTVCNRRKRYAGTLDLGVVIDLGVLGKLRLVIDVKTGVRLDAGMVVQQGAYSDPDNEVWLPNGQVEPLPFFEGAAVLHLRREYADGYKLWFVEQDLLVEARGAFGLMQQVHAWQQSVKARPGRVIYPPLPNGQQPLPLLEDLDGFTKARNLLIKQGHRTLTQVSALTTADLLALKGFGKASLVQTVELLAAYDLTLAGEPGASQTEVA